MDKVIEGVYIRTATEEEFNILTNIIKILNDVISYEIIEVKEDTRSHEYTRGIVLSRKISKGEKLIYVIFKNNMEDDRRIHKSYRLQDASKIKFDFFMEEDVSSLEKC